MIIVDFDRINLTLWNIHKNSSDSKNILKNKIKLLDYIETINIILSDDLVREHCIFVNHSKNKKDDFEIKYKIDYLRIVNKNNESYIIDIPIMITDYTDKRKIVTGFEFYSSCNLHEDDLKNNIGIISLRNEEIKLEKMVDKMEKLNERIKKYSLVKENLRTEDGELRPIKELSEISGLSRALVSYLRRYFEMYPDVNVEEEVCKSESGIVDPKTKKLVKKELETNKDKSLEQISLEAGLITSSYVTGIARKNKSIEKEALIISEKSDKTRKSAIEKILFDREALKKEISKLRKEATPEEENKEEVPYNDSRLKKILEETNKDLEKALREKASLIARLDKYVNASFLDRLKGTKF